MQDFRVKIMVIIIKRIILMIINNYSPKAKLIIPETKSRGLFNNIN